MFQSCIGVISRGCIYHYHIGLILKLRGNYVMAEKHLLPARDLDPEDLFTRQHLAMLLLRST